MILRPLDGAVRRRPIGDKRLAAMANMALQRRAPPGGPGRSATHVARAKRTAREDLLVELVAGAWGQAKGHSHLDLEGLGRWEVGIWDAKAHAPRTSVVVRGVPLEWSTDQFREAFLACNGDRFPGISTKQLEKGLGAPLRLKRRSPSGWTASSSMKLDLPPEVAEAVLAVGYAVVDLESRPIRPFQALPTVCAKCQRPGHKARFCRNASRCRHCPDSTDDHDTRDCPRAGKGRGGASSPEGRRRRMGNSGHRSPPQRDVGARGASSQNE